MLLGVVEQKVLDWIGMDGYHYRLTVFWEHLLTLTNFEKISPSSRVISIKYTAFSDGQVIIGLD